MAPRTSPSFPGPVPREALEYLRAKGLRVGFDHQDVWREEHDNAFTVAKAMTNELLGTIKAAVEDALANGRTLRDFRRDLTPKLQAEGWWGRQEVIDPKTGRPEEAQLGSPRRLRTIFDANLRTARAAGQWERAQRTKDDLPFLILELGPSRVHRPEHVAWAGTILPIDDPFWDVAYPPNGWGCSCRVRQISRAEAERKGGPTPVPPLVMQEWVNRRTGTRMQVPRGIDPGWDRNPGKGRDPNVPALRDKLSVPSTAPIFHEAAKENTTHRAGGNDAQRLTRKGEGIHLFNEGLDTRQLAREVLTRGTIEEPDQAGGGRTQWRRITLQLDQPIGVRKQKGRPDVPLSTVQLKAAPDSKGGWRYHLIPRTGPRSRRGDGPSQID